MSAQFAPGSIYSWSALLWCLRKMLLEQLHGREKWSQRTVRSTLSTAIYPERANPKIFLLSGSQRRCSGQGAIVDTQGANLENRGAQKRTALRLLHGLCLPVAQRSSPGSQNEKGCAAVTGPGFGAHRHPLSFLTPTAAKSSQYRRPDRFRAAGGKDQRAPPESLFYYQRRLASGRCPANGV